MSCDQQIPDFEVLLGEGKTNDVIEKLIKDSAFSVEFLASCVAHYYCTVLTSRTPIAKSLDK